MNNELKYTNEQIINICVNMELGDHAIFTTDHPFKEFELTDMVTSISLMRGNKKSVVYLDRDLNETKPRKIIVADCRLSE